MEIFQPQLKKILGCNRNFRVICDESNNSKYDQAEGKLNIDVFIDKETNPSKNN